MDTINRLKEPLLPSNFLLYARCVSSLLDGIVKHYNKCTAENKVPQITISTFFKGNISRWFNVSYQSKPQFWCTKDWWYNGNDGYLDVVKSIASGGNYKNFLLKRIVGIYTKDQEGEKFIDPRQIIIKAREGIPSFMKINDLLKNTRTQPIKKKKKEKNRVKRKKYLFENIELLETIVPDYVDSIVNHPYIVPLGFSNNNIRPHGWENAVQFFQNTFHTPADSGPPNEGVFYKYCRGKDMESRNYKYVSKDDLFIVQIENQNGQEETPFGIVFNQNEETDTSGIKILQYTQIKKALEEFDLFWKSGTKNINEILR